MLIGIKDAVKLLGISVISCCAAFVCTLFLNYNMDIVGMREQIATEAGRAMYEAQISMGKVTCIVTGGCLGITAFIMLLFYVKNYIDTHGRELGILKALGYSNRSIAKHFWIFGISIFNGCSLGFLLAFSYLPTFYRLQNADKLFPDVEVRFHPTVACLLIGLPVAFFLVASVLYASFTLKAPVLDLLKGKRECEKIRESGTETKALPFLQDLRKHTVKDKKTLVFFIVFSAFCFSSMTQMSFSMKKLASEAFAFMMISIGLILAFVTLFLSLSTVVKANTKTMAMMKVLGYSHRTCGKAILGGYRLFAYLGFAVGSVYQFLLLKIMVTVVFSEIDNIPEHHFDFAAFAVSLVVFIAVYETIMYGYSKRIKKISIKHIMAE